MHFSFTCRCHFRWSIKSWALLPMNNLWYDAFSLQDRQKHTAFTHKYIALNKHCPWYLIFTACVCRDLIRVLKWYVDRIIDAEHQEQIQQVLKVRRLTYYTSFWMYVTVCMQIYEETYAPNLSLSAHHVGVNPHPLLIFWASSPAAMNTLDTSVLLLQPLSPTEVLFLPIMQLSYKHSVFSFVHSPGLLSWPAMGPPGSFSKCIHARLHPSKVLFKSNSHFLTLNPSNLFGHNVCHSSFRVFALSNWKKEENALHTMSPGLTFLPSFLPIYLFIYLKIKNCK